MRTWVLLGLWLALSVTAGARGEGFELNKGDHICIVGNTLAERMQYFGWLETRLVSRFADSDLVFRNLGYSGDEITLRLRSRDFGTPDEWLAASSPIPQPAKLNAGAPVRQNRFELTNTKADVIFAFFGYSESFAGAAGLENFKKELSQWIRHTLSQKYNGKTAPRLVLFSPIAHEDLDDPNLPDGQANNERLKLYTAAMKEVAEAEKATFVDLFTPTLAAYQSAQRPLTINGVHLNEFGDELVAEMIESALFPNGPQIKRDAVALQRLRAAINDKNFYWYHRYRTTDGYSTYGDRAFLRFTDGQSNYEVVQRELEVLDLQTANRDRQVWAVARGGEYRPVDDNLPAFVPVVSNKPGPLAGGKHVFLDPGEESIKLLTIHKGMKVSLFASEQQFPDLVNPVQMAFDTKGRLWVAAWLTYPHWKPTEAMNDKLLILEDTDGDGRADKSTVFADQLHNPTGFEFWGGGVLIAQAPNLVFLKDTDGDDKADQRQLLLHGLDTADTHHAANSFTLDPGGALYFQEGTFHHTQVETPWAPSLRNANAGVYRYEPRSHKFEAYVSYGFANPHGHVFDRWGQDIVIDGTGAVPFHGAIFSGHVDYPQKHSKPPQVYQQRTRPCPALEVLSSRHFPEEMQGDLLVPNVIGFQGILRYKPSDKGSSFTAVEQEPILWSSDPSFRPADVEIAPDGSLYFTDWHNPIIGHMQHNLRDPNRDREHGRVYRVTYEGRPLLSPPKVAGEPIEKLLALLKEPEDRLRYRARIELSARPTAEVIAAAERWMGQLNKADANHEHDLTEVLWLHQQHNVVNTAILERVLASPDFRARAAAVRVLCYWRDRVSSALDLLRKAAADEHPRVRLEAVRAASFFKVPEAIELPLIAAERPSDIYLDYTSGETMKTLEPHVKKAIAAGERIAFATEAGTRYFVRNLSNQQLLEQKRTRVVFQEMLARAGLTDELRREAVAGLARLEGKSELAIVMEAIRALDAKESDQNVSVVFDLVRQLVGRGAGELAAARAELEGLALASRQPVFRQVGFVSLMNIDGSPDRAWSLAAKSTKSLLDFVSAIPLISDPGLRAALYDRTAALLNELPAGLGSGRGVPGRYVRIELPRRGTLTLAEVEIMSGGTNVALRGRPTQKNTASGGDASRAIDGNKSGKYTDRGQTHTEEDTNRPYWEIDLGQEVSIEQVVVHNRTDGDLGKRLAGYTLSVLDADRNEVWKRENLPAPAASDVIDLAGSGPAAAIRHAAMLGMTYFRGKEAESFKSIARFLASDADRAAATRALQRIARAYWPKEDARSLLDIVLGSIKKTKVADRTKPDALAAMEFADALVSLLPVDEARTKRAELQELGVRVIRLGTIFEKMSFDKDVLVVRAGKPVEFVLENSDLMPHNFVIVRPGALEEVGLLAEANAQKPQFAARQYVPETEQVLVGSRLLQPRDSQRVSWTAPKAPGVYPYVCTYPGHWRRMYGALYVVEDLDAYEANPEAYVAAARLEIRDELLKDRRPRTEWKLEDLAGAVTSLSAGRSFANAKQTFTVASCVACHKLDGIGNQLGPDLSQLDAKYQPLDILKEMLEPSAKINEKFQTQVFQLESGATISGLVLEETATSIKLIENPLAKTTPVEIKVADIAARQKSATSIMPKGLLDKLTRDEILDLVALVAARGNKEHALFQGAAVGTGHHHAH